MYAQANKPNKAITSFKSALVYNPKSSYLHFCIARQFRRLKKWNAAFFWATKMMQLNQKDARADHLLGQLYASRKQWGKAVRYYRSAIRKNPKMTASYEDLEQIWRTQYKQRDKLRDVLRQLVKQRPEYYLGYLRLAQLYERLLQDRLALQYYRRALNRHPSDVTALSRMGGILFRQKKWKKAIRAYRLLLDYRPSAWQIRLLLGSIFLIRGQPHDPELATYQFRYVMREVTQLKPADRAFRIGWELHARGFLRASEKWLRKALLYDSNHHQAKLTLGVVLQQQGKRKLALKWFKSIPKNQPAFFVEAQSRVIDTLLMAGKVKQARELLYQIRESMVKVEHWLPLSQAFVERAPRSELQREAKYLEKQIRKKKSAYDLLFQLAYTAFKLRRYRKVESLLQKVLAKKKNHSSALNFLGYVYAVHGVRFAAAEELVRRALSLEPGNAYYLDSLGWVSFRRGDARRAYTLVSQAHHMLPNEAAVTFHFARIVEHLGKHKEAILLYQKSLSLNPPPDVVQKLLPRLRKLRRMR